jgi:hypothetical protein
LLRKLRDVFCRAPLAQRDVPFNDIGYECQITPRSSANLTYNNIDQSGFATGRQKK